MLCAPGSAGAAQPLGIILLLVACCVFAQAPPQSAAPRLEGTSWQLVKFQSGDGRMLTPDDIVGIYEFEPIGEAKSAAFKSPVASSGPVTYECSQTGGGTETLSATFYQTQPALVLVERGGRTRPAFQVIAASGAKYEGHDVTFWKARGEASVIRSGVELKCRRR